MIELFEQQVKMFDRHSSMGNQLKWKNAGIWYKADYLGYEGLAEYVVSNLLKYSSLSEGEYITYDIEELKYRNHIFFGSKSNDMLTDDWQIITLERLFKNQFNQSLAESLGAIPNCKKRLQFLCEQTSRITGIDSFGQYMTKLLSIDALFKNEDRHTNNIAVLMNGKGDYMLCPIFDHGASLLSDTKFGYPLDMDTQTLINAVQAKTVSTDFDEQLHDAEELYGRCLTFNFTKEEVDRILERVPFYGEKEKERVRTILYQQMRKYSYLFVN